jgi:hypothetical protein
MGLRQAQSFFLGFDDQAAGTAVTLTATIQQACLLNDLVLSCGVAGLLTECKIAGQSIMCSDSGMPISAFGYDAALEGARSIAIAVDQQQQIVLNVAPLSSAVVRASIGIDPVDPIAVVDVNSLGDRLNRFFGGGSSGTVAITSTATSTATSRRDCVIGPMVASYTPAANHVIQDATLTSLKVNNLELMNGLSGSDVPLETLLKDATDLDGRTVAYAVQTNTAVVATFRNDDADAGDVYTARWGFFCIPTDLAVAA